jgi:hypothetical protein
MSLSSASVSVLDFLGGMVKLLISLANFHQFPSIPRIGPALFIPLDGATKGLVSSLAEIFSGVNSLAMTVWNLRTPSEWPETIL